LDDVRDIRQKHYGSHATSVVTADPVAGKTATVDFHLKITADHS